jgi:putative SbcD/Mre11-related phosphoesterase
MRFVTGKPALVIGKNLVIADLHLGIEREFRQSGIKLPSQAGRMREELEALIGETKAERLIILGDVKHKVPGISYQELKEVPEFLGHFSKSLRAENIEIILGNHDPGMEELVPEGVKLHPSGGIVLGDVYLGHGHTWPAPSFLSCSKAVIGHRHPMIEFRDRLGYRFIEPVWIRGRLDRERVGRKYKDVPAGLPEIVITPAFNSLAGSVAVNRDVSDDYRKKIGPLINSMDLEKAGAYMLDGTYLGELSGMAEPKFN